MIPSLWGWTVIAVVIGHFGLHVAIYNRINGFGWSRKLIKSMVWMFVLTAAITPIALLWVRADLLLDLYCGRPDQIAIPILLAIYGLICLAMWAVLGIPWLLWRPIFGMEWIKAPRTTEIVNVEQVTDGELGISIKCKLESRLPLNQVFDLAIDQISLPVVGLPPALDGYRIAHFSDIHLTGEVHGDFAKYVVQRATEWQPNLMALTGDIIDSQHCVEWIGDIFSAAAADDGCFFVLGNHDTRIPDPNQTRIAMTKAGWIDVGPGPMAKSLAGTPSLIIGNEHPWFPRPELAASSEAFRLLLSHSPDQFAWARQNRVHLMLAGHTHGGQGRLPVLGPVLGPSFHGSRYASGDFYRKPTTLHVSRGICGTHLVRINCRPQLSLLTLTCG